MTLLRKVPFVALRKAVFKLIKEGQDTPVYGRVPLNASLPYIVLSSSNCVPIPAKDLVLWDVKLEIDAYTDNNNSIKLNEILDDVTTLITAYGAKIEVQDYSIVDVKIDNIETYEAESNCWFGQITASFQLQFMDKYDEIR